ncbi:MAG: menaquinone biosynthesis decarboxylase [Chlorobi bacterium]|nr:menaquinone biosynthesis decarboxylase [Chlorobiota bacterium]
MQNFIKKTEQAGELFRIKTKVNTELEIAEIADRMSKLPDGGKALLFENNGTYFPVLINALGSEKRMQIAFGVDDFNETGEELDAMFKSLTSPKKGFFEKLKMLPELASLSSYMPKTVSGKGKSQEIIHTNPDLSILPILKTWSRDGGKFITFPQVITKDPNTGIRNVGMYRMQVFGKDITGMHWHKHKTGARHFSEYKKLGKKMPIAVALGGHPALTYAATAPLPDNIDEYMLAGFLRKEKVKLVKAVTQNIEVPAEADIIIEGFVDPQEDFIWEGPFGDHTGFFSLPDWYPKFHVTCITHKKNAVYPATVVGIPPMEDAWIAKATERIFLAPIKLTMLPEMTDMNIPNAGVAHNLTLVSIKKSFAGHAQKVMSSLWGAGQMMFNKILTVFDEEVKISDYKQAAQVLSENVNPESDIIFMKGPLDVLDHSSSKFAYGSKLGIDATKKYNEEKNDTNAININTKTIEIDILSVKNKYPEIKEINDELLKDDISFLFISIEKSKKQQVNKLAQSIVKEAGIKKVKFLIFVDFPVNVFDIEQTTWIFANNIEPIRDCSVLKSEDIGEVSHFVIDGTRKRADIDNFKRDWPDIVASDKKTINLVDKKWNEYGIGDFISSPSEKYKHLILSKTAVVE